MKNFCPILIYIVLMIYGINLHSYSKIPVVVLCSHSLSVKHQKGEYYVNSFNRFKKFAEYLSKSKFKTISCKELLDIKNNNKSWDNKKIPLIITFDDGYKDNYELLFPLLKKFNLKATIFLLVHKIEKTNNSLSWENIKEMSDSGLIEFGSHTYNMHETLPKLLKNKEKFNFERYNIQDDLIRSKKELEEKLGVRINAIAYPHGKSSKELQKIAESCGFSIQFTGRETIDPINHSFIDLARIPFTTYFDGISSFKRKVFPILKKKFNIEISY